MDTRIRMRLSATDTFVADRRAFLMGLGAASAAVAAAPLAGLAGVDAGSAAASVARLSARAVPAVFWGLAYMDRSGAVDPYVPPRSYASAGGHDVDPHAELLGHVV